jgi:hypothetical protein
MTAFTIAMDLAGSSSTVTITADGVDEGRWTADAGAMRLAPTVRGARTKIAVTTAGGDDAGTVETLGWLETIATTYRCGAGLEIELPLGGGGRMARWDFRPAE